MEKFVCVRVVQINGADLSLFQFDPELTWAVFFMNADRTIYGRFGTRTGRDARADVTMEGLKKALAGALELHARYPADRAALAAKTGPPPRWKTPSSVPSLRRFGRRATDPKSCIHCHMIHTSGLADRRRLGVRLTDAHLWVFPDPAILGLVLDPRERATLKEVPPGSAAARAGFQAGDRILRLEGQPLISVADVQWVLHRAREPSTLRAEADRKGEILRLDLPLEKGWRRRGKLAWRSLAWFAGDTFLGIHLERTGGGFRIKRFVPGWFEGGNHAARRSGLKKGDVIVRIDGRSPPPTYDELLAWLVLETRFHQTVDLEVERRGRRFHRKLRVQ